MGDTTTMLHADRTRPALVHGGTAPWVASPEPGVQRRLLERIGGEVALATSIVRYAAGSRFAAHVHSLGEEFLVLEGVFSDQHGHYLAGTYVRNPPGSRHAPFSEPGCVIFVKLRQMHPADSGVVRVFEHEYRWQATPARGRMRALLHEANGVSVQLERLHAGAELPLGGPDGADEVFVVHGGVVLSEQPHAPLQRWAWLRRPHGPVATLTSPAGALLWTKRGHLQPAPDDRTVRDH